MREKGLDEYMRNKLSKAERFFDENIMFFLLLCVQAIVLLFLLAGLFSKRNTLEIPLENETFRQIENLTGEIQAADYISKHYSIEPGAYKVLISYTSQKSIENPSYSLNDKVAAVSFASESNPSAVKMDSIALDDGHTDRTSRLWVNSYPTLKDFTMKVAYYGEGRLTLKRVVLQEQIAYRFVKVIKFILAAGLLNFLYLLLWAKGAELPVPRNKEILWLLGMVLIASLPAFTDFIFHGHDIGFHMQRIVSVAEGLANHQFPVRMMSNMLNGYGYANSLFYCDIFLYVPAILYNFMLPLRTCYQVYFILVNMMACIVGYFAFSRMANSRQLGSIGTMLYLFSSYRLVNVHIRAAVGEYTAMCFLPLAVYGMWRIYQEEKTTWKDWLPLAMAMSAIIQCHILTVEIAALFLLLYAVVNFRKTVALKRLIALGKAAAVAAGTSAWFLVPFLQSMATMKVGVNERINKIQSSGLYLIQVFGMFLGGNTSVGSVPRGMTGEMPLAIGITFVLGIAGAAYVCMKRKTWRLEGNPQYKLLRASFLLGMAALVLTLECFPYDGIENVFGKNAAKIVGAIQFSWRYLAAVTVLFCVAILMALVLLKDREPRAYKAGVSLLIFSQIVFAGIFYWQYSYETGEAAFHSGDSPDQTMIVGGGEYLLEDTDVAQAFAAKCEVASGDAAINSYQRTGGGATIGCTNTGNGEAKILLPIFHYGNYHVRDMGTGEECLIETGYNNRVQVSIKAGYEGVLELSYIPPFSWRIAEIISLAAVASILARLVWERKKMFQGLRVF